MRTNSADDRKLITRRHRDLLLAASTLTFLLVVLGGIVCVTGASRGCPDWPACYGQIVPPMRIDSILEYTHRVLAALTSVLIIASAIVGWRKARLNPWVSWPPAIAVALLVAVIIFGALVVLRGLEPGLAALDLGSALMVLALMVAATVVAISCYWEPGATHRPAFQNPFARLALSALLAVLFVLVSGVLVAESGSTVRCLGWPLYGGPLALGDLRGWLQLARLLLAGVTSILLITVVAQAWRRPGAIRNTVAVVAALFLAETLVGALMVVGGSTVLLQVVHVTFAAALWTSLVVLTVLAGLAAPENP